MLRFKRDTEIGFTMQKNPKTKQKNNPNPKNPNPKTKQGLQREGCKVAASERDTTPIPGREGSSSIKTRTMAMCGNWGAAERAQQNPPITTDHDRKGNKLMAGDSLGFASRRRTLPGFLATGSHGGWTETEGIMFRWRKLEKVL